MFSSKSKVDNLDSGKPLQRNYMEKFMTKAQRKREHQPADDRYISSNYNRHKILNDIEPFTEDILQGRSQLFILQKLPN